MHLKLFLLPLSMLGLLSTSSYSPSRFARLLTIYHSLGNTSPPQRRQAFEEAN